MMWQKSSLCKADSPMCVEVAGLDTDLVSVRHSKGPSLHFVTFDREEWQAFIDGVKRGEFDLR
jgi:hypothetical protein